MHIVQRGNNRGPCFFEDADRRFYLHHLARILPEAGCELHAYCLMTNHVHLLVTPLASSSCACLMRRLNLLHSQYMNRKYERTGSLWEGRFRSCIVQSEAYLLNCYRYVELNPVRARLADSPDAFEWSSYRTNARGVPSTLITPMRSINGLVHQPKIDMPLTDRFSVDRSPCSRQSARQRTGIWFSAVALSWTACPRVLAGESSAARQVGPPTGTKTWCVPD